MFYEDYKKEVDAAWSAFEYGEKNKRFMMDSWLKH